MWTICIRECKELFKGFRPIIIIGILVALSYLSARLADAFPAIEDVSKQDSYTLGLTFSIFILGLLFVFTLSHDTINREVQTRTMRFLVTKTSRNKILIGKLLGILFFWIIIVLLCLTLITFYAKTFYFKTLVECVLFLFYAICAALLLSTIVKRTGQSMFLGISISLLLPALTGWAVLTDKFYIQWFKYISPYYYFDLDNPFKLIILVLAGILLALTLFFFKRKDL